ncbi:hypothetical protein GF324_05395 [bacterium]|nr:hypothetical protein [bacterium]
MTSREQIRARLAESIEDEAIVIVDLQVKGSRGRPHVKVVLDHRTRGLTIDDCAAWSRRMEEVLDTEPDFPRTYALDVSSPGVEHPLTELWQFRKHIGRDVELHLHPGEGEEEGRRATGKLEAVEDPHIVLEGGDTIPLAAIREGRIRLPW